MDILIEELEGSLWTAALDNGKLVGLEVDPIHEEVRWGSIYWAKVKTIDKALDAVFLDLDGENTGILYNSDVRFVDDKGKIHKGGAEAIGKRFQPGDMVEGSGENGVSYLPDDYDDYAAPKNTKTPQYEHGYYLAWSLFDLLPATLQETNRIVARAFETKSLRQKINAK